MSDYMKEAERLIAAHESAIRQHDRGAEWDEGPAKTLAALLAHIQRGAVPEPEQIAKWAAGWRCIDESDGLTGEASMLDRIAHAVHGAMLAAAPSPDHFRDATKMMAAPAEVSMPKPVAYGFGNTAITGHTNRLMMVRLDVPLDDQYAGVFWHPLVLADEAHTYGVACRAAGEAAGYARGLRDAVRDAAPLVQNGEVLVTVTGLTGCGKSAIAGEIEIMCRALGLEVEWGEGAAEKHLTHADWTNALEMYRPRVRIVEANVPRTDAALLAHIQRGAVPEGWKEATIAWEVCASIHREYAKKKDPFFTTRQADFVRRTEAARAALLAAAPDNFRDAAKMVAEPAEVPMPQGYVERPSDYTGDIWIESQMRTYGDAREAAGYMRGLAVAGRDAERYRWLRDVSVPPHNFYLSVPDEFAGVRYTPTEVDAAIDAAIDALRGEAKP